MYQAPDGSRNVTVRVLDPVEDYLALLVSSRFPWMPLQNPLKVLYLPLIYGSNPGVSGRSQREGANWKRLGQHTVFDFDFLRGFLAVSRRFSLTPLQHCLLFPEIQWQSRGKRRTSQGCKLETPRPGLPGVHDGVRLDVGCAGPLRRAHSPAGAVRRPGEISTRIQ